MLSLLTAFPALSQWQVDADNSLVTITTTKKQHVMENHRFTNISGEINDSGKVSFVIDLNSIDSKIAIRDQRMQQLLFKTGTFPKAIFTSQLDKKQLKNIPAGLSKTLTLTGEINLHGQKQQLTFDVMVSKLSQKSLLVTSLQPLLIKAEDFKLVAGVNKLKEIASLPSIGYTVPVSFVLTFTAN